MNRSRMKILLGARPLFGVLALLMACAGSHTAQAQAGKSAQPAAVPAPTSAKGDPALAKTLCGLLKKINARAGADPGELRMDLIMGTGKAVDYDPGRVNATKGEIDTLTSAHCPLDRELATANLRVKSLGQALR